MLRDESQGYNGLRYLKTNASWRRDVDAGSVCVHHQLESDLHVLVDDEREHRGMASGPTLDVLFKSLPDGFAIAHAGFSSRFTYGSNRSLKGPYSRTMR